MRIASTDTHGVFFSYFVVYTLPFSIWLNNEENKCYAFNLIIIQVELETESEAEPQNEAPSRLSRKQGT